MHRSLYRVIGLAAALVWLPGMLLGDEPLATAKRILVLGDSNTYAGQYLVYFETALRLEFPERSIEILNLGLPSETVSGLSEPGHAGGQFPRPALRERLGRVLQQFKPDLVVACYGMNCGIYHPYSDERFDAYRRGIRELADATAAASAKLVLLTPPLFDPRPILGQTLPAGEAEYRRPYRDYDQVLALYAAWLVAAQGPGWQAIDIRPPLAECIMRHRIHEPDFVLSGDGVHWNEQAHWLVARELMRRLTCQKIDLNAETPAAAWKPFGSLDSVLETVGQRQRLQRDAWLTATGHQRPGLPTGLPLAEATTAAAALDAQLRQQLQTLSAAPR